MSDFDPAQFTQPKKNIVPIIGIIVGVVVLAVLAVIFFTGKKANPVAASPAPSSAVQPSAAPTGNVASEATAEPQASAKPADIRELQAVIAKNSPIYFQKDSSRLLPGELKKINTIAAALKGYKDIHLKFRGHTAAYNLLQYRYALSLARAQQVRWLFEYRLGYELTSVIIQGLGSRELVKKGERESDRALNRRVEVILQNAAQ